ncbi:KpsF/GutQ family sugar-phosphate isomerase [Candidatus Methylopumilus universalis]|jgi:arabinose-5-phosphate isomerase|uniref:KpsF/GutQ family sugar-phosphate isomerase n=1 Tax=Candidatus Methylopumilus universalis TaxID=2588536 RepID=A0AAX1EXW8_9PROT|nr:KpsF/GutQ family sugar-phosphate isomerase [Candidatus Methylopumilus universalis]QDC40600.1 KpsF/GutQ family sugar-phosphate isomerase [Candidatus Methylopumilus universalis]QDC41889.1 KpsF/GutQ family sugar-phosphate isomerase [Candidatus Methylopumilus universalis]QDC54276.1 KpsF/GutQ family sugar-phosphate isomerase [Candidatus Methylopumilus universalis]QDC55558.1 KpsF/GutQ family sugar-phosphate isomerase [Candidatus Methylopumilus universalis]QDC56839.1 KpsF/GutQ family sugar-phospha
MTKTSSKNTLERARQVLEIEAQEILSLANRLDDHFVNAVQLILHCDGRVVVSGMGKSGHIGRKLASTFASTGTPSFFMHPAEASHGDLGMITSNDVVIFLSNSGKSDELLSILPVIKRIGAKIISITGNTDSELARESEIHLSAHVSQEACPLGLSPTASSTASLALGDALAICVLDQRAFTAEDFARSHPGGSLGKRQVIRVKDIMREIEKAPSIKEDALLSDAILEISLKGLGFTAIVNAQSEPIGIFTDGDLRRQLSKKVDYEKQSIKEIMNKNPKTIFDDQIIIDAINLMDLNKINGILVVNRENKLVGAFNMHDLFKAKVI